MQQALAFYAQDAAQQRPINQVDVLLEDISDERDRRDAAAGARHEGPVGDLFADVHCGDEPEYNLPEEDPDAAK
jgi:hypothetical protein